MFKSLFTLPGKKPWEKQPSAKPFCFRKKPWEKQPSAKPFCFRKKPWEKQPSAKPFSCWKKPWETGFAFAKQSLLRRKKPWHNAKQRFEQRE
jgi:hypothetical protein